MRSFPEIEYALHTMFSSKAGLSEDVAIELYQNNMLNTSVTKALKAELQEAFGNPEFSWMEMLEHPECDYYYAKDEADARACAKRILWDPIFGA